MLARGKWTFSKFPWHVNSFLNKNNTLAFFNQKKEEKFAQKTRMDFLAIFLLLCLQGAVILGQEGPSSSTTRLRSLVGFAGAGSRADNGGGSHVQQGVWTAPGDSLRYAPTFTIQMSNISYDAIHHSNHTYFVLDAHAAAFTPAQVGWSTLSIMHSTNLTYLKNAEFSVKK